MKSSRFFAIYLCYVLLQVLLCNYLNLTYYLTLSILPVLVLLIPVRYSTITAMLIAAASGFLVDFLGDGVLGLNMLALIPVGLVRNGLLNLVFGQEVFAHKEDVKARNVAMKAIGGNLSKLRQAMRLQRKLDVTTARRIADMARSVIRFGYMQNLTGGEVKRLLSATKNAVGREDIEQEAKTVMSVMTQNMLCAWRIKNDSDQMFISFDVRIYSRLPDGSRAGDYGWGG